MQLDQMNQRYVDVKLANLFIGFFEGLFIDGRIRPEEIRALMIWIDTYPDSVHLTHFRNLYDLLIKSYEEPYFLLENKNQVSEVFKLFKNTNYFKAGTADIQRLHGLCAGVIFDQLLNDDEIIALFDWLVARDHLSENFLYVELMHVLSPLKKCKSVGFEIRDSLLSCLGKYLSVDDYGLPLTVVTSDIADVKNSDFDYAEIEIKGAIFCFTGASEKYKKNDWKEVVESLQGVFIDSMNKKVDFLVVCNKGNPHWAQMSYGRKFEQAKKLQKENHHIRILTEDHFYNFI